MDGRLQRRARRGHGAQDPSHRRAARQPASTASSSTACAPPQPAPAPFAALLDAHHYTDGFALVPQGSPTKNTADAVGLRPKDPDYATSFAVERQGAAEPGARLRRQCLRTARHRSGASRPCRSMPTGSTRKAGRTCCSRCGPRRWVTFLAQMMEAVFPPDQIEVRPRIRGRNHHPARADAGVPGGHDALRRPACHLAHRTSFPPEPPFAASRPAWSASSPGSGRSGSPVPPTRRTCDATPAIPDDALIAVLGMDASSTTFRGRAGSRPARSSGTI